MVRSDKRFARVVSGLLLFLAVMPRFGFSQQSRNGQGRNPAVERIQGKLVRVFAAGGETTGWVVKLDREQKLGGAMRKEIEVDPRPKNVKLTPFVDKLVEVTGRVTSRHGVERGERPVIAIETIRLVQNEKSP